MDKVLEEERPDLFEIFSEKVRENVIGLAYLGHIEKETTFCGHTFVLRTLRPVEIAAIAMAIKPYRETLGESFMWSNAHVGLSLVSIDGDSQFCPPIGPDLSTFTKTRLEYLNGAKGLFQPVLDYLYSFYLSLEKEALTVMEEFQNLEPGSQQPSQPSADSLTEPGISLEEIPSDIQPLGISS